MKAFKGLIKVLKCLLKALELIRAKGLIRPYQGQRLFKGHLRPKAF